MLNLAPVDGSSHLELQSMICAYGRTCVVDQVDLVIKPGEHVALTGSNGSGKTTLLRAVLGLHPLQSGRVLIDRSNPKTQQDWQVQRRRIAWMPQRQTTGQFPLLVRELLSSSSAPAEALRSAERLEIAPLIPRPLNSLSGGQLQRVFLARALGSLAGGAGMLLADEPTAALDFDGQVMVAEILRSLQATILVVTHDRKMADRCHRILEMAGGRLREVGL